MVGQVSSYQGDAWAPGGPDVVTRSRLRSLWDGHVLLLYDGDEERRTRTTAWVRRGLELGERVAHRRG